MDSGSESESKNEKIPAYEDPRFSGTSIPIPVTETQEKLPLAISSINQIIRDTIPDNRITSDARDLLLDVCRHFIRGVSTEAQAVATKMNKRSIAHEHLTQALTNLGFGSHCIESAEEVFEHVQEKQRARTKRRRDSRLENSGVPEEELLRQQEELFEQARLKLIESDEQQLADFKRKLEEQQKLERDAGVVRTEIEATDSKRILLDENYDSD